MTRKIQAALFVWTEDEVMKPLPETMHRCRRQYVIGERYALGPVDEVSDASRASFFADMHDIWDSLPEGKEDRFPGFEHFRKQALIHGGWAMHRQMVMASHAAAVGAQSLVLDLDEYAVVAISENVADVWVAKSIARGQISDEEWKTVKPAALAWAHAQINVRAEDRK